MNGRNINIFSIMIFKRLMRQKDTRLSLIPIVNTIFVKIGNSIYAHYNFNEAMKFDGNFFLYYTEGYRMKNYFINQKRDIEKLIEEEKKLTTDRVYLHFLKGRLHEIDTTLNTLFLHHKNQRKQND